MDLHHLFEQISNWTTALPILTIRRSGHAGAAPQPESPLTKILVAVAVQVIIGVIAGGVGSYVTLAIVQTKLGDIEQTVVRLQGEVDSNKSTTDQQVIQIYRDLHGR